MAPTPTRLFRIGLSFAPKGVLNAKREFSRALSTVTWPQLFNKPVVPAALPFEKPTVLVIVDAEEEFDWKIVPPPKSAVRAMSYQTPAQRIFERFGCVPTYAVDYPVAAQRDGYAPLLEFFQSGACLIGAQLHPWLNPPIDEELCARNSFPGDLPPALEEAKLRVLTDVITTNFGFHPTLYRAGRYGLGEHTPALLVQYGYCIDCSVRPFFPRHRDGGPDYRNAYDRPFWLDVCQSVLELPVTVGVTGVLSRFHWLLGPTTRPLLRRLHLGSLMALIQLIDRFQLSPEGTQLKNAKRLTRSMLAHGHRLFVVSYHSPSLQPGNTPYVRTEADLHRFLGWLEDYLEFFLGEIGGRVSTPDEVYKLAASARTSPRNGAGHRRASYAVANSMEPGAE